MGVEWGDAKLLPVRNQCLTSNVTPSSSSCPFIISLGSMPFSPFLPLQYRFPFFYLLHAFLWIFLVCLLSHHRNIRSAITYHAAHMCCGFPFSLPIIAGFVYGPQILPNPGSKLCFQPHFSVFVFYPPTKLDLMVWGLPSAPDSLFSHPPALTLLGVPVRPAFPTPSSAVKLWRSNWDAILNEASLCSSPFLGFKSSNSHTSWYLIF